MAKPPSRPSVRNKSLKKPVPFNAKTEKLPSALLETKAEKVSKSPVVKTPELAKVASVSPPAVATKSVTAKPAPVQTPVKAAELPAAPAVPIENVVVKPASITPAMPPKAEAEPRVQPLATATSKVVDTKQESVKMAENIAAKANEQIKSAFTDVTAQARAAVEKGTKMVEEFNDFAKGNAEAFAASSRAAVKGAETLSQNAAEFSRKSFEEATKAIKSFSAAKSPTEFFKLQNDFAKSQFDALVAEASRVSETIVKIFGDVSEPISSRAAVAADKFKTVVK